VYCAAYVNIGDFLQQRVEYRTEFVRYYYESELLLLNLFAKIHIQ